MTEEQMQDFLPLQQQYQAIFDDKVKFGHRLQDSRKFAEGICRRLYAQEMGKQPDKVMTLETYMEFFKNKKLPLNYIYPQLETIQKLGNFASHDQNHPDPIDLAYIQPALSATDFLMNWYVQKQLHQPHWSFTQGIKQEIQPEPEIAVESSHYELEMVGGAVPLHSNFYIKRDVDKEFMQALKRRDSVILIKGARQVGKTSLLARGIQDARESDICVIWTDCQKLPTSQMKTLDDFLLGISSTLAKQLKLSVSPKSVWDADCLPTTNFENYFMEYILSSTKQPILWAIDEADFLFHHDFSSDVFSLLRSWHNERALDPDNPCHRLSIAIAYATESYLFIKDQNQSPFNVGTKLVLRDFCLEEVTTLNRRYNHPLKNQGEIIAFFILVGGHPYLTRAGLNEMVMKNLSFAEFEAQCLREDGVFGDHLRRIVMLLQKDKELLEVVCGLFRGRIPSYDDFYRLRSAGILTGEDRETTKFRCEVYKRYLQQHLTT
jgi:hypothetical protein